MKEFIDKMHGHECGCGCGEHSHETCACEEADTIDLEFEDGTKLSCAIIGVLELEDEDNKEYIALEDVSDEGGVYVYRYIQEGEDEDGITFTLEDIESEEEYDKVVAALDEIMGMEEVSQED